MNIINIPDSFNRILSVVIVLFINGKFTFQYAVETKLLKF